MRYTKLYYDIEVYKNFWCIVFYNETKDKVTTISSDDDYSEKLEYIKTITDKLVFIGYGNKNYDQFILQLLFNLHKAVSKENLCKMAYVMSKLMIEKDEDDEEETSKKYSNKRGIHGGGILSYYSENPQPLPFDIPQSRNIYNLWETDKKSERVFYQIRDKVSPNTAQLDLSDFNGGQYLSLKEMGIRIHHHKLQTLPIDPDTELRDEDKQTILDYCLNDVVIIYKLAKLYYNDKVQMRENLINGFNLPLPDFTKTDRIITEELLCDYNIKPSNDRFKFKSLVDFKFKTPELRDLLATYEGISFDEETKFKKELELFGIKVQFGLGGLHGVIKNYVVPKGKKLVDIDFSSFYPNIMRVFKLLPKTIRDPNVYYNMITDRVELKHTNPALADAYKVILNTVYGAMNYKGSNAQLSDLRGLYYTTIMGQFIIIKLVEWIYPSYKTIYINTDGIMVEVDEDNDLVDLKSKCDDLASIFDFELGYGKYQKGIIRDVNNFILFGDKPKFKGDYDTSLGSRNHAYGSICYEAMENYIFYDKPVEETIYGCKDIRKFIFAHKYGKQFSPTSLYTNDGREYPFDRFIRYYLSNTNENRVSAYNTGTKQWLNKQHTENVTPCANLSKWKENNYSELPSDIDYDRYILTAYELIEELSGKAVKNNEYIGNLISELEGLL